LEIALLQGEIDLAVHSMKDLPTKLPDGLIIGCITERENPQDVLISNKGYTLATLPPGAKVGTGSLRRRAQLLYYRSDLFIADLRGNLDTRLSKLETHDFDAIILAAAGLIRMGWQSVISEIIPFQILLPAVGQGSLGIEIRHDDGFVQNVIRGLHHDPSAYGILAERSLLAHLEGGCQIPIGAYGKTSGDSIVLEAVVASIDGAKLIKDQIIGKIREYTDLGVRLAERMICSGAKDILDSCRTGE